MKNSRYKSTTSDGNENGTTFSLLPDNTQHLASLQGQLDGNLRIIEQRLQLTISNRGNRFHITGSIAACITGENVLQQLYREAQQTSEVTPEMVHLALVEAQQTMTETSAYIAAPKANQPQDTGLSIRTKRTTIKPRGDTQQSYIRSIRKHDINFGIGPAGTGKTNLAVACAAETLERE